MGSVSHEQAMAQGKRDARERDHGRTDRVALGARGSLRMQGNPQGHPQ